MNQGETYRLPDPYPQPHELQTNLRYAGILLDNFCGPCSEFTAVSQYIHHHMEAASDEVLSSTLRGIAIVEMHHLDLLGSCIRQLGISPKYRYYQGNGFRYWNSSFVFYGSSLRQMLEVDIKGEHEAINDYSKAIACIGEPQIQQLLHRIVADEELHIRCLQDLLHRV